MNFDNDDIMIAKALSDMESSLPMPDLMPGIMEKLSSRKRRHPMRLTAAVVIAAALLITGCAAALGGFEWLLDVLDGGGFTNVVEPVGQSVTEEGIELSVIAAQRYEDTAIMYISLRDTEGRGRVTEDTHPQIRIKDTARRHTDLVYFDAETGTAVYTVAFELDPEENYDTLQFSMFRVDGDYFEDKVVETMRLDAPLSGFASGPEVADEPSSTLPIELGEEIEELPGWRFGAVGTLDGKPFVQLLEPQQGDVKVFDSMEVYALSPEGDRYDVETRITVVDEDFEYDPFSPAYMVYTLIFDAEPEDIEGGALYFGGVYHDRVMGDWELDIELTYDQVKLDYVVDIPVGDGVVEDVKLSFTPVGMSLEGTAPSYEAADEIASAEPVIADEKRTFERYRNISSIETAEGIAFSAHLYYDRTVMPEQVIGIRIGDTVVDLPRDTSLPLQTG